MAKLNNLHLILFINSSLDSSYGCRCLLSISLALAEASDKDGLYLHGAAVLEKLFIVSENTGSSAACD